MTGFLDFLWQGKPPPSVTSNQSSYTSLPDWFQDYQKGILSKGNAIANDPFQVYGGTRIAPATTDQTNAYSSVRTNQGNWQPNLTGATDYTTAAGATFDPTEFAKYQSPYIDGVVNRIAQLGARNLSENLLPQVNDTFTGAGQFGSSRHADFTNRAVRDANESILGQQSLALQQAQDSAMSNYQTAMGRKLQAGEQLGTLGQLQQQLSTQDAAALESIGQSQQQQNQSSLDLAYKDFQEQRDYPRTQVEWLNNLLKGQTTSTSTVGSTSGPASTYQPSGLSQIAGIYSLLKGLKKGGPVRRMAFGGPVSPIAMASSNIGRAGAAPYRLPVRLANAAPLKMRDKIVKRPT